MGGARGYVHLSLIKFIMDFFFFFGCAVTNHIPFVVFSIKIYVRVVRAEPIL